MIASTCCELSVLGGQPGAASGERRHYLDLDWAHLMALSKERIWRWAQKDSNLRPTDYESL